MKISKTALILILLLFTISLILSGSLLLDIYGKFSGGVMKSSEVGSNCMAHYVVGILSILAGIACFIVMTITMAKTKTGKLVTGQLSQKAYNSRTSIAWYGRCWLWTYIICGHDNFNSFFFELEYWRCLRKE